MLDDAEHDFGLAVEHDDLPGLESQFLQQELDVLVRHVGGQDRLAHEAVLEVAVTLGPATREK